MTRQENKAAAAEYGTWARFDVTRAGQTGLETWEDRAYCDAMRAAHYGRAALVDEFAAVGATLVAVHMVGTRLYETPPWNERGTFNEAYRTLTHLHNALRAKLRAI